MENYLKQVESMFPYGSFCRIFYKIPSSKQRDLWMLPDLKEGKPSTIKIERFFKFVYPFARKAPIIIKNVFGRLDKQKFNFLIKGTNGNATCRSFGQLF
jgi:hypothetical protein